MRIPVTKDVISYISQYGGRCRDCADVDGVCPNKGLPCGEDEKAIRHVLKAVNYGVEHGYITAQSSEDK